MPAGMSNSEELRGEIGAMDASLVRMEQLFVRRLDDLEAIIRQGLSRNNSINSNQASGLSIADDPQAEGSAAIDMGALTIDYAHVLGFGSFGNVCGGVLKSPQGPLLVAVKVSNRTLDRAVLAEVRREVRTLKLLSLHPGIVRMHGANFDSTLGRICIVFERASGSLYEHLHGKDVPSLADSSVQGKLFIMSSLAKTLEFVAGSGLVHRDIKSQNVLVFQSDVPGGGITLKLSDFGIARMATDQVRRSAV
jgi:hypothetical protein